MNDTDRNQWITEVINHILTALAKEPRLVESLIFKGARILNFLLQDSRESLDLDSNLDTGFVTSHPQLKDQKSFLEREFPLALQKYFESMTPVRFTLKNLKVESSPIDCHPRGWNAFLIRINISDSLKPDVRGLPAIDIDIAAPEQLGDNATQIFLHQGAPIKVYALHRIAGEKMRAFLSTLPSYRAKVKKPGDAIRVKDLHDLARILKARPINNSAFWHDVGKEFQLACKSRFVDCFGISSFKEDWQKTHQHYLMDTNLNRFIPWEEAENGLGSIVSFFSHKEIIPFEFPLDTLQKTEGRPR